MESIKGKDTRIDEEEQARVHDHKTQPNRIVFIKIHSISNMCIVRCRISFIEQDTSLHLEEQKYALSKDIDAAVRIDYEC